MEIFINGEFYLTIINVRQFSCTVFDVANGTRYKSKAAINRFLLCKN